MSTFIIRPTGDVSITSITKYPSSGGYYANVDEVVSDEDSSYIYSNTETYYGALATFNWEDPPISSGVITNIRMHARMKNTGADITFDTYFRAVLNGTQFTGTTLNIKNNTNYANFYIDFATNPGTSSAWTWSELTSLTAGWNWYSSDTKCSIRMTQTYIEVTYTSPPPPIVLQNLVAQNIVIK